MPILITNIKELIQTEDQPRPVVKGAGMAKLPTLQNAFLFIEGEKIAAFGSMDELDEDSLTHGKQLQRIDASGKMVFPSFVDSHTHLVHAA